MLKPNFKLELISEEGNYAQMHIEPLENGFGHTLGNALRRVLITNLEGAAATSVAIEGVSHQFSTLSGLQENIIEFVLGLKGVAFKLQDGTDEATVKINQKGKKDITAADIECPAEVTVSNPDHLLAHLTDTKAKINATITVKRGVGYLPSEDQQTSEVGVIPMDASFTPIKQVSYAVEATRVGRRTDLDKIILNVETNGTITPLEAVNQAARILTDYFTQIFNPTFEEEETETLATSSTAIEQSVEDLDLSTRLINALKKGGFNKLTDFQKSTRDDLLKVKNLGEKSVDEIISQLAEKGIDVK